MPPALVALVADLLAKDPAARPADAREVIRRLRLMDVTTYEVWDDDIPAVWWQKNVPLATGKVAATGSRAQVRMPTALTIGLRGEL